MTSERTFDTQKPLADDWNSFRERIAKFSQYAFSDDPELLLRRGLIEEAHEIATEKGSDFMDKAHLTGEIGDVLFYLSHIVKVRGDIEIDVDSAHEVPIYSTEDGPLTQIDEPMDKVLVGLLRVCDKMNPYMEKIWTDKHGDIIPSDAQPDMQRTIESAFVALRELAAANDIDLADAMQTTADKLDTRAREPHVIAEDREQSRSEKHLTSGRKRAISALSNLGLQAAFRHEVELLRNSQN